MDFYRKCFAAGIGPGGIKCACCGPAPGKSKRTYRRLAKRRGQRMEKADIHAQIEEMIFG